MKTWLKGGLIGIILAIVYLALSYGFMISSIGTYCPKNQNCEYNILGKIGYPISIFSVIQCSFLTGCKEQGCEILCFPLGVVIVIIEFFVIGSIIGLIIGRIKSRPRRPRP